MRSIYALVAVGIIGCSGGTGDDSPVTPAGDDAAITSETGDETSSPEDSGATEASVDASEDAPPKADTAPADTAPTDPLATLCKDFSSSPLDPPTTCDASGGNTSTEIPGNRLYSTSWFGCYRKSDGTIYKDPTDNCEFACGNKGLCDASATGPECEASLKWFAADADRYGCGSRIRVTNCLNGKQVVLVTLDRGPNCKLEKSYGTPVLDMGHAAMVYLFDGKTYGGSDHERVIIEKVPNTTPLGPVM